MYNCPECNIPLNESSNSNGIIWLCPTCSGKAISIYVLKKVIPDEILNKLWQRAKSGEYITRRVCPVCNKSLPEVPIISDNKTIYLDICIKCCFVWFDGQEYESLPKVETPKPKKELSQEEQEALANLYIEYITNLQKEYDERRKENICFLIDGVLYAFFSSL